MSPNRKTQRISVAKPYTRLAPAGDPLQDHNDVFSSQEQYSTEDRPGFPTYAQYKVVEGAYLKSLTVKRQGKALISQSMFDRIWDVLTQTSGDFSNETPQFRFWARRMFTIARTDDPILQNSSLYQSPVREVLLHDGLLVAIQEQLYELLCYCHGYANHGGRDKTCALIRKNYSWVPKELIAQFVKACPTCILKKCGRTDLKCISLYTSVESDEGIKFETVQSSQNKENEPSLPDLRDYLHKLAAQDQENQIDDGPFTMSQTDFIPESNSVLDALVNHSPDRQPTTYLKDLNGCSMVREVSLYQGIPNGWQLHFDYGTAHTECLKGLNSNNNDPGPVIRGRPRVPSIAPLMYPDTEQRFRVNAFPSVTNEAATHPVGDLAPSQPLQHTQVNLGQGRHELCLDQIDPVLLEMSREGPIHHRPFTMRSSPPPPLHLDGIPSPAFPENFLKIRTAREGSDSPPGSASPTESTGSQLSPFLMTATSSVSPASSLLPTPKDEDIKKEDMLGQTLAEVTNGMVLDSNKDSGYSV